MRWLVATAKQAAQVSDALAVQIILFALMFKAAWRIVVPGFMKMVQYHDMDKQVGTQDFSRWRWFAQ